MSGINLASFGILELTGDNTKSFLQGQVTCNVNKLTPKTAQLGGYTNIKGRLLCVFYLLCLDEKTYWLMMPREIIESVQSVLNRYAAFSRVKLTDKSAEIALLGNFEDAVESWSIVDNKLGLPDGRSIQWGPYAAEKELVNVQKWTQKDIHNKTPWIYKATQEAILPHYSSLVEKEGVSFDKGCYLGQEIVARMHYKGNIKKHTHIVSGFNTPANPGDELHTEQGKKAGLVLYGVGTEALCMCDDGVELVTQTGDKLTIQQE